MRESLLDNFELFVLLLERAFKTGDSKIAQLYFLFKSLVFNFTVSQLFKSLVVLGPYLLEFCLLIVGRLCRLLEKLGLFLELFLEYFDFFLKRLFLVS